MQLEQQANVNHSSAPGILWLIVLAGAVMAAVAATIIDNRVKGTHKQRAHNNLLLVNECLAEHQSAYLIFAIGLVTGTGFTHDWARAGVSIFLIFAVMSYVVGVSITADGEQDIALLHTCEGPKCTVAIPFAKRLRLIWVNLVLSVILVTCSVLFCVLAVKAPV